MTHGQKNKIIQLDVLYEIILAIQGRSINQYKNLGIKSSRFKNNILMFLTETGNYFVVFYFKNTNECPPQKLS